MRLRQILCGLRGHLPVTKRGGGRIWSECYVCGRRLGAGWSLEGLAPPRRPTEASGARLRRVAAARAVPFRRRADDDV
ncbi:MAG TPA: hypothetical protein VNI83_02580 [Vicinamibacterales bacterium]|nr:hypothetical protein [Vicinamibacterales bacterium]